jgi:hypothetical protein
MRIVQRGKAQPADNAMMDEWTKQRSPRPGHIGFQPDDEGGSRKYDREALRKKALDDRLDKGLEESFPASDPVAVTQPTYSPYDRHGP